MFSLFCFTGVILGLLVLDMKKIIDICKLKEKGQKFLKERVGL